MLHAQSTHSRKCLSDQVKGLGILEMCTAAFSKLLHTLGSLRLRCDGSHPNASHIDACRGFALGSRVSRDLSYCENHLLLKLSSGWSLGKPVVKKQMAL